MLRIEGNRGKGYALNYGLQRIKSGIVVFIDADVGQSAVELKNWLHQFFRESGYDNRVLPRHRAREDLAW